MKKTYLPVCFIIIIMINSCSKEDFTPVKVIDPGEYQLLEVKENKKVKDSFNYEVDKLVSHVQIDSPVIRIFTYHYDLNYNRLDTIYVSELTYNHSSFNNTITPAYNNYRIVPVYEHNRFSEFYFYQDDYHYYRVVLGYDSIGRIAMLSQIYPSWGLAMKIVFYWNGDNIIKYEKTYNDGMNGITWEYEFTYDSNQNPYAVVFRDFNFDFIRFLPLSRNNYITCKEYSLKYPDVERLYSNLLTYSGKKGYPVMKMTTIDDFNGKKIQVFSTYKYKNLTL